MDTTQLTDSALHVLRAAVPVAMLPHVKNAIAGTLKIQESWELAQSAQMAALDAQVLMFVQIARSYMNSRIIDVKA